MVVNQGKVCRWFGWFNASWVVEVHCLRFEAGFNSGKKRRIWADLRAARNGSKEIYAIYFQVATIVVEEITVAAANRHGAQRVLQSSRTDLVSPRDPNLISIPALDKLITSRLRASDQVEYREAPTPSYHPLWMALCPQHETRMVARSYNSCLELTRAIVQATMRKTNIDSHYNNKMNKYANELILEMNNIIYDIAPNQVRATCDNPLLFSKGFTKMSVENKVSTPVGEPGQPIRTSVKPMPASLVATSKAIDPNALDHDFHKASLVSSFCLFSVTPENINGSFRNGHVVASIKEKATQRSTAIRHAAETVNMIRAKVKQEDALRLGLGILASVPEQTSMPF